MVRAGMQACLCCCGGGSWRHPSLPLQGCRGRSCARMPKTWRWGCAGMRPPRGCPSWASSMSAASSSSPESPRRALQHAQRSNHTPFLPLLIMCSFFLSGVSLLHFRMLLKDCGHCLEVAVLAGPSADSKVGANMFERQIMHVRAG